MQLAGPKWQTQEKTYDGTSSRGQKNLKNIRKRFHPHRNPLDAMLLPGIADGEGEQLGWLLQSSSHSTQQSICDRKEMAMVLFKTKTYFFLVWCLFLFSKLQFRGSLGFIWERLTTNFA